MAKKKKGKKSFKKIVILLALLIVAYGVLWIITPSVNQYYGTDGSLIANLELPLLEKGEELIEHTGFSLVYAEEYEQAKWVAYQLTRDEVYGDVTRKDNFRADPNIKTGSATPSDYVRSGYDRGHLAPAADLGWSEEAMSDSFYMSNMSPQDPSFNRGIWSSLEAFVRNYAAIEGEIYVVTGPVLTDGPYKTIGKNEVAIPNYYYKVILDYTEPEKKMIGFVLPNEGSKESLESFATTVDYVQQLTGIDFFHQLPDEEEFLLESTFDYSLWPNEEFRVTKAEKEAYAADSSSFVPAQKESSTILFIKEIVDEIMVMTKKEITSLFNYFTKRLQANFT
jgi:endonuclease G